MIHTGLSANAQTAREVCGSTSESFTQQEKGNLDARAQTIARIGAAEITGAAERTRTEVVFGANRSDAARHLQYLTIVSCVLIFSDTRLTTDEKLARIRALSTILNRPVEEPSDPLPINPRRPAPANSPQGFNAIGKWQIVTDNGNVFDFRIDRCDGRFVGRLAHVSSNIEGDHIVSCSVIENAIIFVRNNPQLPRPQVYTGTWQNHDSIRGSYTHFNAPETGFRMIR
ncbi:hypothetical protein [Paracraurococcus ruber]|uniref:hypothetical protein n=1 Tax=Paracraurococcus ruber TaxID=77675 RepID=UPI001057E409|nr:hypothetical protein [Paracraurococcus ruber]TDG28957.1 hypothetical protein E2C05_19095 [Paracraurococcus ruber]